MSNGKRRDSDDSSEDEAETEELKANRSSTKHKHGAKGKGGSDLAVLEVSALDEIDAGSCEGMSVDDFPKVQ